MKLRSRLPLVLIAIAAGTGLLVPTSALALDAPIAADVAPTPAAEAGLATLALPAAAAVQIPGQGSAEERVGWQERADNAMGVVNTIISAVFFFDVMFWNDVTLPLVVLWLVLAAVFLTVRMGFINVRAFTHAIQVTRGRYTDPKEPGEVSHFQALTTALSATVGLGNIAGVAIAVSVGGPGATFWMIVAGLIGMSTKFAECTLAQAYRDVGPSGNVLGGPMQYLSRGLAEKGLAPLGKVLAVLFAFLCIGGSLAGGNSFQVNQSLNAVQETLPILGQYNWAYGLVMTFFVGIVIIGGLRRIAQVTDKIVPVMAVVYVLGCVTVILMNFTDVPAALLYITTQAFNPDAMYGGFIGVLVVGFQRAAFSNEAGAGSAAIAHSAARTDEPVREGIVALLEPFIDTVVICTMTALVIVFSGAYANPAYADVIAANQGAALTSRAFGEDLPFFSYVLSVAVMMFAYSTMISWSYYGERCAVWLFGAKASMPYKVVFLTFTFLGSIITATQILNFGDLMILGMAFPNLLGVYILSGKVKSMLDDYWKRYKSDQFKVYETGKSAGV
ncbi:MAG: alanine/glycine:cation symporter family protein [Gemmatimonadota bacterium]